MAARKKSAGKARQLGGCIVASVTPMKNSGAIDYPAYRRLVNWFIDQGVDGICAAGTTGESPTLEPSEHSRFIARTVRIVDGRVPVVAGTGANSTAEAVSLTRAACADGADYCLSVVPYYNRPPQEGLRRHFEKIADKSTRPIILYNVPGRTVADLADETVGLLARHPRIAGIKDATGDILRAVKIRELTDESFLLLSGDDTSARIFMQNGGNGVISVTANVAPAAMSRMTRAAGSGDRKAAAAIERKLAAFNSLQGVQANPIPVKWALHAAGRIGTGLRLPLTVLATGHRSAVAKAAREAARA